MSYCSMRTLFLAAAWTTAMVVSGAGIHERSPYISFSKAYSGTQPTEIIIRSRIEVDDKRVSLLDLCEQANLSEQWKTLFSGVNIGSSPELGAEKYINPEQLTSFINQTLRSKGMDQDSVKIIVPEKITVARKEVRLTLSQIQDIYKQYILSKVPWQPEDIVVHDVYCPEAPALPPGNMTYEVVSTPHERYVGSIGVTINFYVDGKRARSLQVSGKVDLYQNVVYSRIPLRQNDVISEDQIKLIRTNIAEHPDRYATRVEEVVGKRLVSSVGLNQPINLRDLDKPLAIKRGNPVTIVYKYQGLTLTAKGQAKENGSEGDRIRVVNVDSKQTIFCQIVDSRTVQVMAGGL